VQPCAAGGLVDNGLNKDFLEELRVFMRDEHYTQRDLGRLLQCSQVYCAERSRANALQNGLTSGFAALCV
jgi:hypothetical protein